MTNVSERGELIANLGVYKKQAKALKRSFGEGDATAIARVRVAFETANRDNPRDAELTLGDAQFVIAHELGFGNWRKLKERVLELEAAPPPTPLMRAFEAIARQEVALLKQLLAEHPGLVDAARDDGALPLIEACDRGDAPVVQALLEAGADPNRGNDDTTPLLAAVHAGPHKSEPAKQVVDLLLMHGAPNDIYLQAALGDTQQLQTLLEKVETIDAPGPLGSTALYLAAWNGQVAAVELLLDRGADPSLPGRKGETPLACAMAHSWSAPHRTVAVTLVERAAECTLFEACRVGHLPTVERLLVTRDVDETNELGYRALDIAVFEGNLTLTKLLLDRGAQDADGRGAALLKAKATRDANLGPQLFERVNLGHTVFHDANLGSATFSDVNLAGARFDNVNLGGARIQDAHIAGLTIWGVDVMPLVQAAMQERDRKK